MRVVSAYVATDWYLLPAPQHNTQVRHFVNPGLAPGVGWMPFMSEHRAYRLYAHITWHTWRRLGCIDAAGVADVRSAVRSACERTADCGPRSTNPERELGGDLSAPAAPVAWSAPATPRVSDDPPAPLRRPRRRAGRVGPARRPAARVHARASARRAVPRQPRRGGDGRRRGLGVQRQRRAQHLGRRTTRVSGPPGHRLPGRRRPGDLRSRLDA